MANPRVPPILVGGRANLTDLFVALGRSRGVPRDEVERISRLVPEAIKRSPCFLDRLTGLWRYDFGAPYTDVGAGGTFLGTHMYQEVDRLYNVLSCASRRFTTGQLATYLARLDDPEKHEDMLSEFAPVMRLPPTTLLDYEVTGYSAEGRSIDWLIRPEGGVALLIDVKNRVKDLIENLARIQAGERDPDGAAPAPTHDPMVLFTGVEEKFVPLRAGGPWQGVFVLTALKQHEPDLARAFQRLEPSRIQFSVLGGWGDGAYVLCRDPATEAGVRTTLALPNPGDFVFRREGQ